MREVCWNWNNNLNYKFRSSAQISFEISRRPSIRKCKTTTKGIRLSLEIAFSVNVTAIVIGKHFTLSVECRPKLSTATQGRSRKKDVDLSYFFVFRLSPFLPLSLPLHARLSIRREYSCCWKCVPDAYRTETSHS